MAAASDETVCPSEELLAKLASGACEGRDAAELLAHTERCAPCARWLADAKNGEAVLPWVRGTLDAEAEEVTTGPPLDIPIEGYVLEAEIGRGGMGVVYRAYQKATKRHVALKVLLEGPFASETTKRRFEREVESAAQLQHPCIVTILESGVSNGRCYFAMEYVEGMRLDKYVRTSPDFGPAAGRKSIKKLLALFSKICDAISYAHKRSVIHRDLKPGNILVDARGEPHILDFGLAKMVEPDEDRSHLTVTGAFMGTLAYASPEQVGGNPSAIDTRTDVYSLGVILYELLTAHLPYTVVGTMAEVLRNIAAAEPQRPSSWCQKAKRAARSVDEDSASHRVDNEIETIVLKALAKEPERRYQTAEGFRLDIENYLTGRPLDAKPDDALYILRKLASRHLHATIILALVFVVFAAWALIAGHFYWQARMATRQRAQSDAIAGQRQQELEGHAVDARVAGRKMALELFLAMWREGYVGGAEKIMDLTYKTRASQAAPEYAAMSFLLEEQPVSEDLLAELGPDHSALAYLAIGERYQKSGQTDQAIRAFESAIEGQGSPWVIDAAKERHRSLRSAHVGGARPMGRAE